MRINEVIQLTTEGVNDPHIFKAVFMAGAPGAGKTTIAKQLFGGTGLRTLNVDQFWQLYNVKGREGDYEQYWKKYRKQYKGFLHGRIGLIIDGTAKNPQKMALTKKTLERLGYDTCMVFVNTTLDVSLERTVRRAVEPGKDQGRVIDRDFVEKTWQRVQHAVGPLQNIFEPNFYMINNNSSDRSNIEPKVQKAINAWLNAPPSSKAAEEWIAQQKAAAVRPTGRPMAQPQAAPAQQPAQAQPKVSIFKKAADANMQAANDRA